MEEKLNVGYADGESHDQARTRKRVGKFDAQVRKGVRDMKVYGYLVPCTPCTMYNFNGSHL